MRRDAADKFEIAEADFGFPGGAEDKVHVRQRK